MAVCPDSVCIVKQVLHEAAARLMVVMYLQIVAVPDSRASRYGPLPGTMSCNHHGEQQSVSYTMFSLGCNFGLTVKLLINCLEVC
jgi:hypothetical protein